MYNIKEKSKSHEAKQNNNKLKIYIFNSLNLLSETNHQLHKINIILLIIMKF